MLEVSGEPVLVESGLAKLPLGGWGRINNIFVTYHASTNKGKAKASVPATRKIKFILI